MKKLLLISLMILFGCAKDSTEDNSSVYVTPQSSNIGGANTTTSTTQYTLTVTAGSGGSVSTAGGTYNSGSSVSITATPSSGNGFVGWSNGSSDNPLTVTVDSNINITANFETYQVTVSSYGNLIVNENVPIGIEIEFNGNIYKIISEEELRQMVIDGEDLSYVITSKVTNMSGLFKDTIVNGNITSWDTFNVTDMSQMFYNTDNFNQNISNWRVNNVTTMKEMFYGTDSFNIDISGWSTSSVTDMSGMFAYSIFNQPIGGALPNGEVLDGMYKWDVRYVTDMSRMFKGSLFNQNIGPLCTGNVTNMSSMFEDSSFNSNLMPGPYDPRIAEYYIFMDTCPGFVTSKVTDMSRMFKNSSFTLWVGEFDVENVTNMEEMFYGTGAYVTSPGDNVIGVYNWQPINVVNMNKMFYDSSLLLRDLSYYWLEEIVSNVTQCFLCFEQPTTSQPIFTNCNTYASVDGRYDYNISDINMLAGQYRRVPIENDWHQVDINIINDSLVWQNAAGVSWNLEIIDGYLWTASDSPYGAQRLGITFWYDSYFETYKIDFIFFNNEEYTRLYYYD